MGAFLSNARTVIFCDFVGLRVGVIGVAYRVANNVVVTASGWRDAYTGAALAGPLLSRYGNTESLQRRPHQ